MKAEKIYKLLILIALVVLLACAAAACAPSIRPGDPMPVTEDERVIPTPVVTEPVAEPTVEPTPEPTAEPTAEPTVEPTAEPTPTAEPEPTVNPVLKDYSFNYSVEGNAVCPEPVWPDLSVAYTVEEADYTVVPEDIAGMFTKESFPKVDGSTATIPISEAIYQYATGASEQEASEAIVHTKTSQSYYRLFDGDSDILIVYEPSDAVVELMKEHPCKIKPIGLDALVFMANTNNPVESLTMGQLQRIYTGELENWSEVGGEDSPIYAFQRPVGTGSQNLIEKVVMGDLPMSTGDNVFYYSTMSDILEGMLSYNGEDNTLGYSVFYYANNMYYLPELRFMAVDGVLPSTQTIYDGSYKLVNPFYAVIREDEPEDSGAHRLFDWLTSDTAQQMMIDLGYVPVNMPENAVFGGTQTYVKGNAEVYPVQDLNEGEYFIYYNRYSVNPEESYGDVIIFDNKWQPVMTFYNVSFEWNCAGVNKGGAICISQYRMTPAGEMKSYRGIYDIAAGKYTLEPAERNLSTCDSELGYFFIQDEKSEHYRINIIDRYGNLLHENVAIIESPSFYRNKDVFLEYDFGEFDETNGEYPNQVWNVYDLELKLIKTLDAVEDADEVEELQDYGYDAEYIRKEFNIDPENPDMYRIYVSPDEYAVVDGTGATLYLSGEQLELKGRGIRATALEDGTIIWEYYTGETISFQGDYAWQEYGWTPDENVETVYLYDIIITKDGKLRWRPDKPMNLVDLAGGFLQDFYGDYNTVYDPDGNIIIRKLNNNRIHD